MENPEKPGTFVDIPRPVTEIRAWDPETRGYVNVETRMVGAPPPEEEEKYWSDLLDELRQFHGADVVDGTSATDITDGGVEDATTGEDGADDAT